MSKTQFADLDPFASPWDNDTSIGAGARDIADIGDDGDDDEDDDILATIGAELFDDEDLDEDDAHLYVEEPGDLIAGESIGLKFRYNHDKAATRIRKVTRSPATHIALGALATQAPHGTAAAAVAEAGLGAAELWAEMGGSAIKAVDTVGKVLTSPFKRKKKRKKGKKLGDYSSDELREKIKEYQRFQKSMPFMAAPYKKLEEEAKRILQSRLDAREDAAATDLEETNERARRGDKKAAAKLVAIQFLTNPKMVRAQVLAKAQAAGVKEAKARAMAAAQARNASEQMRRITKKAKTKAQKRGKTRRKKPAKSMPNTAKTKKLIEDAASALEKRVTRAARKRGPLNGVLVPLASKRSRRSGRFDNGEKNGTPGWVVTKKGRAIPGIWGAA